MVNLGLPIAINEAGTRFTCIELIPLFRGAITPAHVPEIADLPESTSVMPVIEEVGEESDEPRD